MKGWELNLGDKCEKGSQLRPHIVWFGEMVPKMDDAIEVTKEADIIMVVGTSMVVYPAAGLIHTVDHWVPKFIIDPNMPEIGPMENLYLFEENGGVGVPKVAEILRKKFN